MRGIEKIVDQILNEAYEKEEELLNEAHIEVEKIEKEFGEKVETLIIENEKNILEEMKKIEELSKLSIEQKNRRAILEKKQHIIDSILEESYKEMISLEGDRYFEILSDMVLKFAQKEAGVIYFNEKDLNNIPDSVKASLLESAKTKGGSLELGKKSIDIDKGFVLVYGGIEENCSFKALMDSKREDLQDLIQKILFG